MSKLWKRLRPYKKAVLAFLYPLLAAVGAAVVSWIATGTFNGQEIRLACGGLVASGLAALGAYVGRNEKPATRPRVALGHKKPV